MKAAVGAKSAFLSGMCLIQSSFWAAGATIVVPACEPKLVEITRRMAETERAKGENLLEYSVVRKFVLRNSRLGKDAELTARVCYRKGRGKSFEILDGQSAQGMSRKVIERVLQAEVEASANDGKEEASITPAHYDFDLLGTETLNGRRCYVLDLQPKKKSKFLIEGKAWVDAEEFAIVKLEGRPSASLSMWVGKPFISQEFQKYAGFWMASRNSSRSESRLLGNSQLTIDFAEYELRSSEQNATAFKGSGNRLNTISEGFLRP